MARPGYLIVSCCRAPGLPPGHQPLHALDDRALVDEIRRLAFAPEWLLSEPATLRGFLGLLRSDFEMAESYIHRPGPPLAVPITAIAGTRDRITRTADVAAWRTCTTDRFRSIELEGSHDLALTRVGDMLALIQDSLPEDATSGAGS
jgi:surfactin synthase thioesterase subunit